MGSEIRGLTIWQEPIDDIGLDEGIQRLKDLRKRLELDTLFNPTQESIDITIEILNLINHLNVPVRMTEEGQA
tara:strand:+ start:2924 stop:3142 length:219 start_codon:yes stop_codon:yes gene_type:complete